MKKTERSILIVCLIAIVWGFSALYLSMRKSHSSVSAHPVIAAILAQKTVPNTALSLITEPDAGTTPIITMINKAQSSVDLVIYTLNDKKIEDALVNAHTRGLSVRVMLNAGYNNVPSKTDVTTSNYLLAHGVSVKWSPTYFTLTHQKTLVADDSQALIMTFNLDRTYYKKDRDFGVIDSDPSDVVAIEQTFDSDWNAQKIATISGADLVWSPDSENDLVSLIESAKGSLFVYNEEMNEEPIENALEDAARRGVNVEVLMTMAGNWVSAFTALSAAGVHVRTYDSKAMLYIHAKMILADDALAYLGSENFSTTSLLDNRELGIIFSKRDLLNSLSSIFQKDWNGAQAFQTN